MSSVPPKARSSSSSAASRHQRAELKLKQQIDEFILSDKISSFNELQEKLSSATLPTGFQTQILENSLLLFLIDYDVFPKISASLKINADLTWTCWLQDKQITHRQMSLLQQTIDNISSVLNCLAQLKAMVDNKTNVNYVDIAISALSNQIDLQNENTDEKLLFILEQLQLYKLPENNLRYSSSLTITCFSLYCASTSAYQHLRNSNILTLPSPYTLRKLTRSVNPDMTKIDTSYLSKRVSSLSFFQTHVTLIFDEIYVARRVEYSRAQKSAVGLSPDLQTARTILVFMISSISDEFRDVISMIPISKISADLIKNHFWNSVEQLTKAGLNVVAVTADNHACNRRAFLELLGGQWVPSLTNPFNNQPIFVLFDAVHNIKNIYNNMVNKKEIQYFHEGSLKTFKQSHLQYLVNSEKGRPLKLAPQLKERYLYPNNLDRLSTKPALAVINEKTCAALEFYSTNEVETSETVTLINMFLRVWKILNVKTPVAGKMKKDKFKDPIKCMTDWRLGVLNEFQSFLHEWRESGVRGLTKPSMTAWYQSLGATISCAQHLLQNIGFNYVMLGQLQSDPIERRFGLYRQRHGGNYYVSVRQVFETERKLRAMNLTRFCPEKLDSQEQVPICNNQIAETFYNRLAEPESPDEADLNAVFYVAGALCKSELKARDCSSCKELLTTSEEVHLPQDYDHSTAQFYNSLNRSGLITPSNMCFDIILWFWELFSMIQTNNDLFLE